MNEDDSGVSASLDIDRLLFLIQNNPAIYNSSLKEHHNVDVIYKIWNDIGKELNVPGIICKTKWNNLRNSYVRYLRELKKTPSGSAQKKKKWHLADDMEFVLPWTGPCRKMSSNLDKPFDPDVASPSTQEAITVDVRDEEETNNEASWESGNFIPKKKQKKTPADLVASQMAEYLKTVTQKRKLEEDKEESEMLSFFKSLILDAKKLSARRKRMFKTSVMTTLHQLLDEQEDEQESYANISSSAF